MRKITSTLLFGLLMLFAGSIHGQTTETTSPGVAIPDNTPAGIQSTLTVGANVTISDLDVVLRVTHTWVGDLAVTLQSPLGTTVTVYDRPGIPGSTFSKTLE